MHLPIGNFATLKAIVIKHVPFEGCGNIEDWLRARGADWRYLRLYDNDPLPQQHPDLVVLMGGPMSVNDEAEFPWLAREKACIREWIAAGVPLLGVCLGAQLIASAMGGRVNAGEKEIGWFPVEATGQIGPIALPDRFTPLHWHGDHIELPPAAISLARSAACDNQVFSLGQRTIGLQCHLETTADSLNAIVRNCGHELREEGVYIQSERALMQGLAEHNAQLRELMQSILDVLVPLP